MAAWLIQVTTANGVQYVENATVNQIKTNADRRQAFRFPSFDGANEFLRVWGNRFAFATMVTVQE